MAEPKVKAGLWVQAALRLGAGDGRPGVVIHRGDADSGGILVLLRGRAGLVILSQTRDGEGNPAWLRAAGPDPVDEARADAYIEKQRRFDPDLWVIEFEAPDYVPPFEAKLL
ncbi:MAG TPA: DUF1491 family protein [Acidiphilium sp.]